MLGCRPLLLVACLAPLLSLAAPTPSLDEWIAQRQSTATTAQQGVSALASQVAIHALGLLGVPYRWGGNSAQTGLDCSAFVKTVFQQSAGVVLPRITADQAQATQTIALEQLQPGDLVFYNTRRRHFSHVGIYVGNGRFVHSPRAGATVRVETMTNRYWLTRFNGARRVPLE